MAGTGRPEHGAGNTEDQVVDAARQEVRTEIQNAGANTGQKVNLLREAIQRFFSRDVAAHELQRHVLANQGKVSVDERSKAETNLRSISRVLEIIRQVGRDASFRDEVQRQLNISPRSLTLIEKVDEKIGRRIGYTSSSFIYPLIQRALQTELTAEDVKNEFNHIKETYGFYSPRLVQYLSEALVDAARAGAVPGLTSEEARQQFEYSPEAAEKRAEELLEEQTGRRKIVVLTADEQKHLDELSRRIINSPNLSHTQSQNLLDKLIDGDFSAQTLTQLRRAGITDVEFEEFRPMLEKANRYRLISGTHPDLARYFPKEDQEMFTVKYLLGNNPDHKVYLDRNGLTDDGKRMLKRAALHAVNRLFENADMAPDREFQNSYSEFHEGYFYRDILAVINNLLKDPGWSRYGPLGSDQRLSVQRFVEKGLLEEVARERELRELYHNIGIWIKTLTPKDLASYLARYNTSDVTSVTLSDVSGKLVSLAMNEYERYIKYDIGLSGGKVRPGLFAGKVNPNLLYFDNEDRSNLDQRLRRTVRALQAYAGTNEGRVVEAALGQQDIKKYDIDNLREVEDWEYARALKYAKGLQLTVTIRGFEIIASARPPETYEGSADNTYDMAGFLGANWKWRLGRGQFGPRELHAPEMLIAEALVKKPEQSLLKRIFTTKGWNPQKVHREVQAYAGEQMSKKWETVRDQWLYRDMDFRRLIKLFGLGGLYGRGGWRTGAFKGKFEKYIESIQDVICDQLGRATGEKYKFPKDLSSYVDWVKTYDALARIAGVGTRYWFDADRSKHFIQQMLLRKLGKWEDFLAGNVSQSEIDKIWYDYTDGKMGDKEVLEMPDHEKFTAGQMAEIKTLVFQGLNFYDLLQRSPLDFLNNILNLTPQLLTKDLGSVLGGGVDDYYFEFNRERLEEMCGGAGMNRSTNIENAIKFQRELRRIWGKANFDHLKFIRNFYHRLEDWGHNNHWDNKKTLEEFYTQMDAAIEIVKLRNYKTMRPEDITDDSLRQLIFGEGNTDETTGLVTYFRRLNEDFGFTVVRDNQGRVTGGVDTEIGQRGFFYHMARGWYNELGTALHPDTSDVDWRFIFHELGTKAGETLTRRLWGDLHSWNEVTSKLMDFDHMLQRAAQSHNMKEIHELHAAIHTLEPIAGKASIYEAQYYLAQLVARYFQEHYSARLPLPLGWVAGMFLGKTLALSRIYGGRGAMTLTTDGINAYYQQLAYTGMIQPEGNFGLARLQKALGADWQKLVITEIIPNIISALVLFLFWQYLKKSLEETEGKKK